MRIRARHYATGEVIDVTSDSGQIVSVGPPDGRPVDREAPWVSPSLFDLQINGCNGHGFSSPDLTEDEVYEIVAVCRSHGIGGLLPTLVTNSFEALAHGFGTLHRARRDPVVARTVAEYHLEGPYISPEDGPRGAHPKAHVRPPDWDEFRRLQDAAAGPARIRDAIKAGAKLSTHLGNGSHALLPRHDNYVWEQLADDELWASIIADGFHLPPALVRCIVRVKTPARTVLTCDASSLAGLPPGRYTQWEQEFEVQPGGKVVVPGTPFLAGSGVFLDACVGGVIRMAGVSLRDAIDMASARPRELLGRPPRRIEPGASAELLLFDWQEGGDLTVRELVG